MTAGLANGTANPIVVDNVVHHFGAGSLRKQILFDVSLRIGAGEIVILTGPSGSGKTTLLTLMGALRRVHGGSVRILDQELNGASAARAARVRRHIGYIFQAHNLLMALNATQNVQMALRLHGDLGRAQIRRRAVEMLESVGLGERLGHYPSQLSGGQRQRVAIARALAARPRIILADEPTASLDKQSGREVVTLMHNLAKRDGVTVLLVTHDNRILDIADRIVHLEDGRICSLTSAVTANTQRMMELLAEQTRKGALRHHVAELPEGEFREVLEKTTAECQQFLEVVEMSQNDAFEGMLSQMLDIFSEKIAEIMGAERASLFLVDAERAQFYAKVATAGSTEGRPEIRVPLDSGIVGRVYATGEPMNVPDAYREPLFNPAVDRETGFRTRSILCVPIRSHGSSVFAVAQILNRRDGAPFEERDLRRFEGFSESLGVVLESWWRMDAATRQSGR
jgi:putative ABC transport system ATP-binding protein